MTGEAVRQWIGPRLVDLEVAADVYSLKPVE